MGNEETRNEKQRNMDISIVVCCFVVFVNRYVQKISINPTKLKFTKVLHVSFLDVFVEFEVPGSCAIIVIVTGSHQSSSENNASTSVLVFKRR